MSQYGAQSENTQHRREKVMLDQVNFQMSQHIIKRPHIPG